DIVYAIGTDGSNVYITGESGGNGSGLDIVTLKYSQLTVVNLRSGEIPTNYSLSQNYPNPFNPVTRIKFQIPHQGNVHLAIYDIMGKEMEVIVNENLQPGTYEIEWNATNFASGVYYYRITAGDFSETKKLILIK